MDLLQPDTELSQLLGRAHECALNALHEFITPEHLILQALGFSVFSDALKRLGVNLEELQLQLSYWLHSNLERVPEDMECEVEMSPTLTRAVVSASVRAQSAGRESITWEHLLDAIVQFEDCAGVYILMRKLGDRSFTDLLSAMAAVRNHGKPSFGQQIDLGDPEEVEKEMKRIRIKVAEQEEDEDLHHDLDMLGLGESSSNCPTDWKQLVSCLNDEYTSRNPLIGRTAELERTIQILCRRDCNNALHLGEPGVGKTALMYGLAALIEKGEVPERLRGRKIYRVDMGDIVAGTRYRGDFEERIQCIAKGAADEGNAILYFDEMHTMVGAGSTSDGMLDASNMLKRHLEDTRVMVVGATTFDEYKRSIARQPALSRRFHTVEIAEPSRDEAVRIVEALLPVYSEFHGVGFEAGMAAYAVDMSVRHIHDRFLPDKAVNLIDEAASYRELHPKPGPDGNTVGKDAVEEVLAKVCRVESLAMKADDADFARSLADRILSRVYGQDSAVRSVSESVLMSRAGLTGQGKPVGSFLFVGPTGVGKTELARVLATELGIGLVRFDMSEYTEKHTVAKLIGSPAGYVGYDDGGLLTDAIRKTPNCVLLLDEIEKAHPDIYNILLQVMDYARLTDNQGRSADFSNVILVMTSNAGAQNAAQAKVGFGSNVSAAQAMMREVKRVFKPEFINRLNSIETFNDMDRTMASRILDKSLSQLQDLLNDKNIVLSLSQEVREWLLDKGFSAQYGARELDRVIERHIKRMLSHEILFGSLRDGGRACVVLEDNVPAISNQLK